MEIKRNVVVAQAANCHLCIHIGGTAVYFGDRSGHGYGLRIEIMTPCVNFRISPWSR